MAEKAQKTSIEGSNPSARTINKLIKSSLQMSNDKSLTKSTNFKPAKVYDAGGDLTKQWFVYYSFLDPSTGKFRRFKILRDINSFNLKGERSDRARLICVAVNELLEEGYNPFKEFGSGNDFSVSACVDIFLEKAESSLKFNSYKRFKYELDRFKNWLSDNNLSELNISEVKKSHIFQFMDYSKRVGNWTSGKTYNTNKANLARFFNYFINNYDDVITSNPVTRIESVPEIQQGNIPYNESEFKLIRDYILENDPYLWRICQFTYYAAVRNGSEAINLRVKNIDFVSSQIIVPGDITKGKIRQSIPIYPEFMEVLLEMDLKKFHPDWFIFGKGDKPGPERVEENYFNRRFKKIKDALGLGREYGIYSFKHTRGCHLVEDGATLYEIQTLYRHTDLHATMKYLKSIGRVIGKKELTSSRKI